MIEIVYGIGFLVMFIILMNETGHTPLEKGLSKLFLAFMFAAGWPWFAIVYIFRKIFLSSKVEEEITITTEVRESTIVSCEQCGQKLRIPKGKFLEIKCPNCKKEWRKSG
jgi:ribosomal protein S27E